ncbi:MAG: rhomboid family intramembrane serine protease [Saprospiraceae bacterium]
MGESVIGVVLTLILGATSYKGFRDRRYFEDHVFDVDKILIHKDYQRLIASGFLHGGWFHLGFNLIALLSFSASVEYRLGPGFFLLIYFVSLIGGNLLALYIHRNHGDYRAVGASGAISGVIFSSILLFPGGSIGFVILPFEIKNWIFGIAFVLISILGIKRQADNIGHEAHLGGAIIGVLATLLIRPSLLMEQPWLIAGILVPVVAFLYLVVKNPAILMIDHYWGETIQSARHIKMRPRKTDHSPVNKEEELNTLLDKIRKQGMGSLTTAEKKRLEELSK